MSQSNAYTAIIEAIFHSGFREGMTRVEFERGDIAKAAQERNVPVPKNPGDVLYCFRYRQPIPDSIRGTAPPGQEWAIKGLGLGRYGFVLGPPARLEPNRQLATTKVLDATPGIVARYALGDEQALLAKVRYNRLVDIFTGITCYSLQNHLRTFVPSIGQIETDELYVGIDTRGCQYVIPLQAKGGDDVLSLVQIEQDAALCDSKFPTLICCPAAAQFMAEDVIALFAFEKVDDGVRMTAERHYRLSSSRAT